jgi:hypothetical protein
MKKYNDNEAGAREFIVKETTITDKIVSIKPDPDVRGVWCIEFPNKFAIIIFMGGYPDPWGKIREHNDFDEGYL